MRKNRGYFGIALAGVLLAALSARAQNNTPTAIQQATHVAAPVTAVAIGPSRATVEINTIETTGGWSKRQNVTVTAPVTVISTPLWNASVRIGVTR